MTLTLAVPSITRTTGFPAVINFSLQVVVMSAEMLKEMDGNPADDREKRIHRATWYLEFNTFFFPTKPESFIKTLFSDLITEKHQFNLLHVWKFNLIPTGIHM